MGGRGGNFPPADKEFQDTVLQIRRVSKKAVGGNRISFTALIVAGDGKGKVGLGLGKAKDVSSAVQKGIRLAKKEMIIVPLKGSTIPHTVTAKYKGAKVLLKPGKIGDGLVAGGVARTIAVSAGIKDLVAKILGSRNKMSNALAILKALGKFKVDRRRN